MPSMLELAVDDARLRELQGDLAGIRNGVRRAIVVAVNRTARAGRSDIVKRVAAATGMRQKDVRERNTALELANYTRWTAKIKLRARAIPLVRLHPRQMKAGVRYRLQGEQRMEERAFMATMPSGHRGVFRRVARGGKLVPRLPIRELYGPSALDILDPQWRNIELDLTDRLDHEIDGQVRRLTEKR